MRVIQNTQTASIKEDKISQDASDYFVLLLLCLEQ